jgi:hypothetical protein
MMRNTVSFTATTASSTISVHGAGAWCGVRISCTAATAIHTPAPSSITHTTSAASDSARPCPYGCSASGGRDPYRIPAEVMRLAATSVSDSSASAISAYECPRTPAASFAAASTRLTPSPRRAKRSVAGAGWCCGSPRSMGARVEPSPCGPRMVVVAARV